MAITAKFVADFEDFTRGVQGAGAKLLTFEQQADRAGGRLMDLGKKGQDAEPRLSGLSSTLHNFDGALASMGIHIGPEIKALGELGEASGKTATQLGLVTSAGFAVAAAIGGWKIGRLIADFTGSDQAIGDWVAHAMGWTDELERAGAKADVLARASKTAGHEITSFAEAMKINAEAAADQALAWGKSANAAHDTMVAVSGWQKEIRNVRKSGDFEALTADMELGILSTEKLSIKYGIHAGAIQYLAKQIADAAKVQAAADAAAVKGQQAVEAAAKEAATFREARFKQQLDLDVKLRESTQKLTDSYLKLTNEGVMRELEAQTKLNAAQGLDASGAIAHQVTALETLNDTLHTLQQTEIAGFSIKAQTQVAQDAYSAALIAEARAGEQANQAAAAVPAVVDPAAASIAAAGASAQQAASGFFSMSAELYNAIRAAQLMDEASGRFGHQIFTGTIGGIMPHMATGGPVLRDGPIYAHAGEYVLPKGGGGGGVTIVVNGSLLSTKAELARLVKDALADSHRSGGGRMPA